MVDIRLFFGGPAPNKKRSQPAAETPPRKAQKTESKYFKDQGKSEESNGEAPADLSRQSVKKETKASPKKTTRGSAQSSPKKAASQTKESPIKLKPKKETSTGNTTPPNSRKRKRVTYVDLDSGLEDSEDEFKPNNDAEDEEDDFEIEEVKEELDESGPEEPESNNEDDLMEVEPEPKPKRRPAQTSKAKTPAKALGNNPPQLEGTGVHADDVLGSIPDAELPDAPETDGKLNYFALKNRQQNVPAPSGAVELPEAAPNCLGGLTIVFTGVLPNLDRDASESVAKRYGARVTKSISKKTSLVVIGEEAGPSKVKKIKDFGIKAIDENGFLELLRRMPADGGDSEQAMAAKRKREEEEQAVLDQAMAEEEAEKKAEQEAEKEAQRRAKQRAQEQAAQRRKGATTPPPPEPQAPREIPNSEKLWTVKYAPTNVLQLCGNKGQIQKLKTWLSNWFENSRRDFKVSGADNAGLFRAALISGPPGIGKTTAAHLVAQELGFDVLEKNASDVRSKSLLNSELKSVLNNTSVVGFFKDKDSDDKNKRRFCLIMDEVDGMSSGDHGGAGALSAFCRITRMPMILICNDKSLPKMRTFDKVTYNLPFRRPTEVEMRARLLTIAHREKLKLEPAVIGNLAEATGSDIRQIINLMLTVLKTQKTIGHENARGIADSWKKHVALKPFDIAASLLGGHHFGANLKSTLNDKLDLYFSDIDFAPLMIQENYLATHPSVLSKKEHLQRVASAADSILASDGINSLIRSSEQQWSLLPFHGVMSTVRPALEVCGKIVSRINFALWLGQNSKGTKNQRLLQELQYHARLRTLTSKSEMRLDYVPVLRGVMTKPLVEQGEDGIATVIDTLDHYYLTKDDWDSVLELGVGVPMPNIATKVKSAFTRRYNGLQHPVAIYRTGNSIANRVPRQKVDYEDVVDDDTARDDEEEDKEEKEKGEIDPKDKLIKVGKPKKTKAKAPKKTKK